MKKIIAFEWLSLDGFIAGPNEETDWFVWDKEIEKFAKEFQTSIDTMLFGRTTYEVNGSLLANRSVSIRRQKHHRFYEQCQ
jgi:dihydrofolate reductase